MSGPASANSLRSAVQPRSLPPIHSASLLQGPSGVTLNLQGDGGAMTQVPLTLAALREIAALAGSALSDGSAEGRHPAAGWLAAMDGSGAAEPR